MGNGLVVAGDVYPALLGADGSFTGYLDPINVTKLVITQPDPDKVERPSNMEATLGQALGTVYYPKSPELEFDTDNADRDILAMMFYGTAVALSQAAVSNAAFSGIVARLGKWVPLPNKNLSAIAVTGKTEGVDYAVDYAGGMIKTLSGGTIADGATIAGTLSANAITGFRVKGLTNTSQRLRLLLKGTNKDNGKKCRLEIDDVTIAPSGGVDLMGRKYVTATFKGTMVTLPGATEPFRYEEF